MALGDTPRPKHPRRGIPPHGHTVGATGRETMPMHHLFEVNKHARDFPAPGIQAQSIADRQWLGDPNSGPQFPALAALAPAQPAQGLRGAILLPFDLDQGGPGYAPRDTSLRQRAQPAPPLAPV